MVENAPTFADIWKDLRIYLDNRIVIAHNAFLIWVYCAVVFGNII